MDDRALVDQTHLPSGSILRAGELDGRFACVLGSKCGTACLLVPVLRIYYTVPGGCVVCVAVPRTTLVETYRRYTCGTSGPHREHGGSMYRYSTLRLLSTESCCRLHSRLGRSMLDDIRVDVSVGSSGTRSHPVVLLRLGTHVGSRIVVCAL